MPIYRLDAAQTLSTDLQTAWEFFSDPHNLAFITPSDMRFQITGDPPALVHPGLIITYRLTPLPILPLRVSWATEIAQVHAPHFFSDVQVAGPYALWHHEHHFQESEAGVLATDRIHWSLPLDPISSPIANQVVAPQLRHIFHFRARKLRELFGSSESASFKLRIRPL
jgi:ligand-binding SRPBCC domain-containing protein